MENKQHPVQNVMNTAMQNIKDMLDVNTVVGNPITAPDGTVIIPVSRVGVGFASGGSDFNSKASPENPNFGGGSGAGISITPVAFLVVSSKGEVSIIPVNSNGVGSGIDKLVASVPEVIDQVKGAFGKKGGDK